MLPPNEEYFPRGGSKPGPVKLTKPKQDNLFGKNVDKSKTKAKKARKDKSKVQNEIVGSEQAHSPVADVLSYNKIQDGMLILSIIRNIKSLSMEIELPGRVYGNLSVKSISNQYYNELNKRLQLNTNDSTDLTQLDKIFTVGQVIPTKVLSMNDSEKGPKIMLSTLPDSINSAKQHHNCVQDMLLWGAIMEKSDHVYLIDIGVKNCRVVLPFTKVETNKSYNIGDPLYCVVTKSENLKEASTLTVSALQDDIANSTESSEINLDHVIPGMQVDYTIEKILKDGLQGKFFNECMGYINELYLSNTLDNVGNYSVGQTIKARVLYTQPTTKFTYLTLRNLDTVEIPSLKIGDTLSSKVISRAGNGVILRLKKSEKGFVTHKRILNTIKANADNINEIVRNKYAIGTDHTCRILDYCRMDGMYICTFEPSIIKEKFLMKTDLKIGELVKGVIKEIIPHGVILGIGSVEGLVSNIHLGSSEYTDNIKKMFKVGQHCNAKLLSIDPQSGNVKLTMKPDLLNSDIILKSYEDIKNNEEGVGVVVLIGNNGCLLTFYGDVKGWLPKSEIPLLQSEDFRNMFYVGQVVKCMVKNKENIRVTLTLNPPKLSKKKTLMAGKVFLGAKIKKIDVLGMEVEISEKKTLAFLPTEQLCHGSLGPAFLKSYSIGDILPSIMCISGGSPPIMSLKECSEFATNDIKIPFLQELKPGVVLRCLYNKHLDFGISLSSPIRNYPKNFVVFNESIVDTGISEDIKFQPHQTIIAKVLGADFEEEKFKFTTKLSDVFSYDYKYSVNLLKSYLLDLNQIQQRFLEQGNKLAELKIGQSCDCIINKISKNGGCSVFVSSKKVQGLVEIAHCPKNLKSGSKMNGVVLSINFQHNYASISLKPSIISKISPIQDGKIDDNLINSTCYGDILTVNSDYALAVLRNIGANKQLVYLPVKLHENDFYPNCQYYNQLINQKVKIILSANVDGLLIGVEKNMAKILNKSISNTKPHLVLLKKSTDEEEISENKIVLKRKLNQKTKTNQVKIKNTNKKKIDTNIKNVSNIKPKSAKDVNKNMETSDDEGIESDDTIQREHGMIQDDGNIEENSSSDDSSEEEMEVDTEASIKEEIDSEVVCKTEESDQEEETNETGPILPGIRSFFKPPEIKDEAENSSSDEDDENDQPKQKKKKKLTPAERAEQIRVEEERLRTIENDLADSTTLPQNAEQFDRILLGNPDNSEMWTRYIAFHAQSTEFEKARLVAKRALEKISYTAVQERLNVWLAYLNLENMYGTKESFDTAFEEASRCNDTLTIYLEAIKMFAEMQKFTEMDEKIKKVRGKYKQDLHMWLEVGKVYYSCKRFVDARKLKDIAIVTLADRKTHVSLLVQFAILEFNQGEQNQGEALFETILQSDPKRVDVWSTYVDQLIKKNDIDLARNVLGRAVGQKLPYKKMRTLFKKYHSFEKTYGTEETIEHVKSLLKEYADK